MSKPTLFDEGTSASRFPVLDLLDRPDDLAAALEDSLVSPQLPELVEELALFVAAPAAVDNLPAELRARILASGLRDLSVDEHRLLLRQPRVLLDLQKAVLLEGGGYWDAVIARKQPGVAKVPRKRNTAWYRSSWAWAANATTGIAAGIAVIVFGAGKPGSDSAVERQLRDEIAALRLAHPPVAPADLPEEPTAVSTTDPLDLPETDPEDLPEAPKKARSNVDL